MTDEVDRGVMGVAVRSVALVVVLFAVFLALRVDSPNRPNILLISVDTLRSDHLHVYGYPRETSPTIDRIAREGALFTTVIAPSAWTLPSHVTLLTAQPPEQHAVGATKVRLPIETTTLAEVLRDVGYETAAFVAGTFLRSTYGYRQGFDVYDESVVERGGSPDAGLTSPPLLELVSTWLDDWRSQASSQPFFIFLHLWDPHYDYAPPPPYDEMFDPEYAGAITGAGYSGNALIQPHMDRRDLEHIIALYDGEIRYTDEHIGKLLARLDEIGVLDETIVVVTSDHGESFFEHGVKGHATTLFDEILRIPLVIRYPRRVRPGTVVEAQVRLMDVAPTVLGLAGVQAPDDFGTGSEHASREQDLSRWLSGERPLESFPRLFAFSQTMLFGNEVNAVRGAGYKLILGSTPNGTDRRLFDLGVDPAERRNLARRGRRPRLAERFAQRSREWSGHWGGAGSTAGGIDLSPEHVERLRALGYVE